MLRRLMLGKLSMAMAKSLRKLSLGGRRRSQDLINYAVF